MTTEGPSAKAAPRRSVQEGAAQGESLPDGKAARGAWSLWLQVIFYTYLLLLAVAMVSGGFKLAAADRAAQLFAFAGDPITALMIGLLSTALVQSSSTVTSITVGLVAGGLPVATAVPIIMGANLGTTVTNTLVSLGHIRDKAEFRRAFAAATVHDFFNLLALFIFFPLELLFHPLEKFAGMVASLLSSGGVSGSESSFNPIKTATKPVVKLLEGLLAPLGDVPAGIILAVLGILTILLSITLVGRVLKMVMVGRAKRLLHDAIGRGPLRGITSGTIMTVLVQSSSTTTSLTVPLVGSGVFTMRDIYPFVLGANIGTCVTAIIAALGVSDHQEVALQIALVHLFYNSAAVLVLFGLPIFRNLPLKLADGLAELATRSKLWVLGYVVGCFFILPALLILL